MLRGIKSSSLNSIIFYNKYSFIPPTCYDLNTKINPILSVKFGVGQSVLGTLKFRLFESIVPKTSQNFKRLLLGVGQYQSKKLTLIGTGISRYVPRGFIELGNMPDGNCSIYGPKFRDQSFQLLHDKPGLLSSLSQENTNNSQFLITLAPASFLDYKNVVFGEVIPQSMKNLRNLQKMGDEMKKLKIIEVTQDQQKVEHHHHH